MQTTSLSPRTNNHISNPSPQRRSNEALGKEVKLFVPIFKGGKTEAATFEVTRYIDACQNLWNEASYAEQEPLFRCFLTRLEGEAYERVALSGPTTVDELKNTLIRAYGPQKRFQEFTQDAKMCTTVPRKRAKAQRIISHGSIEHIGWHVVPPKQDTHIHSHGLQLCRI